MKSIHIFRLIIFTGGIFAMSLMAYSQNYIADYKVAKEEVLRSIPQNYINKARGELVIAFQHTSHGTHVSRGMYGLQDYKSGDNTLFAISRFKKKSGKLYFQDEPLEEYPPGAKDLSAGETTFVATTRNFLDARENKDVNVVIWAWCDIWGRDVSGNYLPGMAILISEYGEGGSKIGTGSGQRELPVTFVFLTGDSKVGDNVGEGRSKNQAQLIVDYCNANGHLCIDIYSINTHDMDDNYWEDTGDNGNSASYGGNFYQDYQDAHTLGMDYYESKLNPDGPVEYGTHTTQHIISNRKAYAMWWILARIAGWEGTSSSQAVLSDQEKVVIYPNPGNGLFYVDSLQGNIKNVQIINAAGKKVVDIVPATETGTMELDLSDFASGMYLVRIENEQNEEFYNKLILLEKSSI